MPNSAHIYFYQINHFLRKMYYQHLFSWWTARIKFICGIITIICDFKISSRTARAIKNECGWGHALCWCRKKCSNVLKGPFEWASEFKSMSWNYIALRMSSVRLYTSNLHIYVSMFDVVFMHAFFAPFSCSIIQPFELQCRWLLLVMKDYKIDE